MPSSVTRKNTRPLLDAIADAYRAQRLDLAKLKLGTIFHGEKASVTGTIGSASAIRTYYAALNAAASATDLATTIIIANAAKNLYNAHRQSAIDATTGLGAHVAADSTNATAAADATDQSSANTLLNEIKTDLNAHLTQSGVHFTNDGTNSISSANATDLATSQTLANEIKTDLLAHVEAGFSAASMIEIGPA